MKILKSLTAVAAAALLVPVGAQAQTADDGDWEINLVGGTMLYAESSTLETGASIGLEALYRLNPRISFGPSIDYVRTNTDGTFYIAVMDYGISEFRVYEVGQTVAAFQYNASLRVDLLPGGTLNPYLVGGGGMYSIYLSGEANDGATRITNPMAQIGGGVEYAITEATGIRLDVRDMVYTSWDREVLNPIRMAHRNCSELSGCRVPSAERSNPVDHQDTIHNIRVSLGFTYIPGARR
jgi:outer membrane protein W